MFNSAFSSLVDFFGYVVSIFWRLISSMSGALQLIIAAFFITVVVQLILIPIRGGRGFSGSDKASKKQPSKKQASRKEG